MLKFIDNFLNKITMYRLVLYSLFFLILVAEILCIFKILPYNPIMLLISTLGILVICWAIDLLFSKIFNAPANVESSYITALILALIITPPDSLKDPEYLLFIFWASVIAIASKYILTIKKKHIFNPAAISVAITAICINQSASWWTGTVSMIPFVLLTGFLITRKVRRTDLVLSFIVIALAGNILTHWNDLANAPKLIERSILSSPLLFFAFFMLTEPLTTPPTRKYRLAYGGLVGAIFDPMVHIWGVYSTPELALCFGNIFSYIISPKEKLILKLKEKKKIAQDTYDFSFDTDDDEIEFSPGQYLEWTLGHPRPDNRGNRRYFTIASSPIEEDLRIGVKFYGEPSSFKKTLFDMKKGDTIVASQLSGDFTMPHSKHAKLCFIAGGIGVTPFQSMITYMLERKQKRDVTIFYSNKIQEDIAYTDTFEKAKNELGINTIYTLSDEKSIPENWTGEKGFVTADMLKSKMPDYKERIYFISGPHGMVSSFRKTLSEMGIKKSQIKTDFFPGFV